MTRDEIIREQSYYSKVTESKEIRDLFEKLLSEHEEWTGNMSKLSAVQALDKYAEEYSAAINILTQFSDLVENDLIDSGDADVLLEQLNLLDKMVKEYIDNNAYFSTDWSEFWYCIISNQTDVS